MSKIPIKRENQNFKQIVISRTDAIGDVILTIPLAGFLKSLYPETEIVFIARAYTKAILEKSRFIDRIVLDDEFDKYAKTNNPDVIIMVFPDKQISEIAKRHRVKWRIGTSHRWWHWLHCNIRVDFTRRRSDKHEAQLNFELLQGLGLNSEPEMQVLTEWFGFPKPTTSPSEKFKLIFHPKSRGSARDWSLGNYKELGRQLPEDKFDIVITGTEAEKKIILEEDPLFFESGRFQDKMGKFSLEELFDFILECDGIVACSTGPLHIAAATGKFALGLYPPIRPMHPGRWAPIGSKARVITGKSECSNCPQPQNCACMLAISPEIVAKEIISHFNSPNLQE